MVSLRRVIVIVRRQSFWNNAVSDANIEIRYCDEPGVCIRDADKSVQVSSVLPWIGT